MKHTKQDVMAKHMTALNFVELWQSGRGTPAMLNAAAKAILERKPEPEKGAMGLPYTVAGEAAQALASAACDRVDGPTREQMVAYLTGDYYDEDEFWNLFGGPATDWFEGNAREVVP